MPTADASHAAAKAVEWLSRRDDAIRAARADGVSLRVLATATGLSHGTVDNICHR